MDAQDRRKKLLGATMTTDPQSGIVLDRENDVIRHGYRSAIDQINELMRAGQNLQMSREDRYAVPTGINARLYGEIDRTIAVEKKDAFEKGVKEKIEKAYQDKIEVDKARRESERKTKEAAEKAAKTPPQGDGVN